MLLLSLTSRTGTKEDHHTRPPSPALPAHYFSVERSQMTTHLYLDIDGVIVMEPTPPYPADFRALDVRVADGRFVPVAYSESIVTALAEVLAEGSVQITVASSWQADAPYLFREIGLPEVDWLDLSGPTHASMFDRKHTAVREHVQLHRPKRVMWIDDHLPKSEMECGPLAASLECDDTFLLSPSANACLTSEHLARIGDFVRALSPAES